MKNHPFVFAFRDNIIGNGYVANVSLDGRALMEVNDSVPGIPDVWLYGVQPGGVASGGDIGDTAAFAAFKKSYLGVLYDIAADARTFDEFNVEAIRFLNEINPSASTGRKRWSRRARITMAPGMSSDAATESRGSRSRSSRRRSRTRG